VVRPSAISTAGLYLDLQRAASIDGRANSGGWVPFAALGLPAFLSRPVHRRRAPPLVRRRSTSARPLARGPLLGGRCGVVHRVCARPISSRGFPWKPPRLRLERTCRPWSRVPPISGSTASSLLTVLVAGRAGRRRWSMLRAPAGLDPAGIRFQSRGPGRPSCWMLAGGATRLYQGKRRDGPRGGVSGLVQTRHPPQSLKWRNDQLRSNFCEAYCNEPAAGPPIPAEMSSIWFGKRASPYFIESDPEGAAPRPPEVATAGRTLLNRPGRRAPASTAPGRLQPHLEQPGGARPRGRGARPPTDKATSSCPFGEYVPLRGVLPIQTAFVPGASMGHVPPGPGPRTLCHLPGLPPVGARSILL